MRRYRLILISILLSLSVLLISQPADATWWWRYVDNVVDITDNVVDAAKASRKLHLSDDVAKALSPEALHVLKYTDFDLSTSWLLTGSDNTFELSSIYGNHKFTVSDLKSESLLSKIASVQEAPGLIISDPKSDTISSKIASSQEPSELIIHELESETSSFETLPLQKVAEPYKLFILEDIYFKNVDIFSNVSDVVEISVLRADGTTFVTHRVDVDNGRFEHLLKLDRSSDVFISASSPSDLDSIIWLTQRRLERQNISVISLFDSDDVSTIQAIDEAVGELHTPFSDVQESGLSSALSSLRRKMVFLVGHVEGSDFIVRGADNKVVERYSIASLEKIAQEQNSTLVLLGCEAGLASRSSGFITPVRDLMVAQGLSNAVRARTYEQVFSSFTTPETPIVIRSESVGQLYPFIEAHTDRSKELQKAYGTAVKSVRIISSRSPKSQEINGATDKQSIPIRSLVFPHTLFIGCLLLSDKNKIFWSKFKSKWYLLPKLKLRNPASIVHHAARMMMFFIWLNFFIIGIYIRAVASLAK